MLKKVFRDLYKTMAVLLIKLTNDIQRFFKDTNKDVIDILSRGIKEEHKKYLNHMRNYEKNIFEVVNICQK